MDTSIGPATRHILGLLVAALQLMLVMSLAAKGIELDTEVCNSIECTVLAADIAKRMNTSADPCEDFYNYACGNFRSVVRYDPDKAFNSRLPREHYLFQDAFSTMEKRLKENVYEMLVLDSVAEGSDPDINDLYNFTRLFFRSCSQWMRLNDDNSNQFSNYESSVEFMKDIFKHLMAEIAPTSTSVEQKNSLEFILAKLVVSGVESMLKVTLPAEFAEKVLLSDYELANISRAMVEANPLLYNSQPDLRPYILFFTGNKISLPLALSGQAETFATILGELRNSSQDKSWTTDCPVKPSQGQFTVRELDVMSQCALPESPFVWKIFFEELLQTSIDPEALVHVPDAATTINFVSYFKSRPIYNNRGTRFSEHASLLVFDWLLSFADFLPRELSKTWKLSNIRNLQLERPKGDIIEGCMMWTRRFLQPIVERMYQSAYHPEAFQDVKTLVQAIQNASIDSIQSQDWITDTAKEAIIRKLLSVKQSIGFDQLTTDQLTSFYNTTLQAYRETTVPNQVEKGFGRLLSIALCAYARKNFDVMSGSSPVTIFLELNPLVINAFNFIERNQIIFPMAILAPPVYHVNYPVYINLGSLGYIIGHEIGHSFDNNGHELNPLGTLGHFWDNDTEANYLERTECVRSRYGNYSLYPGGPLHQSNSTLGNDIADIIGIKAALGALRLLKSARVPMPSLPRLPSDLNPDRLFFIQAAQGWCFKSEPRILHSIFARAPSHSPHHLRVRGIAQNTQEFAEIFGCQNGQEMAPENRCEFW